MHHNLLEMNLTILQFMLIISFQIPLNVASFPKMLTSILLTSFKLIQIKQMHLLILLLTIQSRKLFGLFHLHQQLDQLMQLIQQVQQVLLHLHQVSIQQHRPNPIIINLYLMEQTVLLNVILHILHVIKFGKHILDLVACYFLTLLQFIHLL